MSKELDKLSTTVKEYEDLFLPSKATESRQRTLMERVADSFFLSMLFFPLVVLIDGLNDLKHEKCVHVTDAIEVWMKFLLLGGAYTAVAFAGSMLLYKLAMLPVEAQIALISIILVLVLIIAVPTWLIVRWANKK